MSQTKKSNNLKKTIAVLIAMVIISPALKAQETSQEAVAPLSEDSRISYEEILSSFSLVSREAPALSSGAKTETLITVQPRMSRDASQYIGKSFGSNKVEAALFQSTLVSMVALNIADYFTTRKAMKYEGLAEGNPMMKPFVKNDLAFAAIKMGLTLGNHLIMTKLHKRNKTLAWTLSIISNLALAYVVSSNMKMIRSVQ